MPSRSAAAAPSSPPPSSGPIRDAETREAWARRRLFNPSEQPTEDEVRKRLELHDRCIYQWPDGASMGDYRNAVRSSYGSNTTLQLACMHARRKAREP